MSEFDRAVSDFDMFLDAIDTINEEVVDVKFKLLQDIQWIMNELLVFDFRCKLDNCCCDGIILLSKGSSIKRRMFANIA